MENVTTNEYAAYQWAELISTGNFKDVFIYEIHQEIDENSIFENYTEEFIRRSSPYYSAIMRPEYEIDAFAANIGIAIRISGEWFIHEDCGSNYYLGFGPTGILKLREACFNHGLKIHVVDNNIQDWLANKFANEVIKGQMASPDKIQFEEIVKHMQLMFADMQRRKPAFNQLEEESIRDIVLSSINGAFHGRANGEAKNVDGKTDILIRTADGINEQIFELKVWKGLNSLKNTIKQLKGYLHFNNDYAGIIMLCRNDNFSNIISTVSNYLNANYETVNIEQKLNDFRFHLPYGIDDYKSTTTHVFLVNLK